MRSLIVEGWRGISQSYAMVNQYQLRELRKHGLDLFHVDAPYYAAHWNEARSGHGFPESIYQEMARIAPAPEGFISDVYYRISVPYRFTACNAKKLYVFGTSEFQNLIGYVDENRLQDGLDNRDLTIVTPSRWSAQGFYRAGFDESRVLVIPHGVDPEIFKPISKDSRREFRQAINIDDAEFMILSVGAMTPNKGIKALIIAYALLREKHRHVRLVLKSHPGLYDVSTRDLVSQLKLEQPRLVNDAVDASIVHLAQPVTLAQLRGLYGAADCYASPYLAEGFNLPPLEAAACGTPIVVTRGGATDDYVDESFALKIDGTKMSDGTNFWIEPNLDSLVYQLTVLIENRRSSIVKEKAIEFIGRGFSWHAVVNRLVDAMFA
jgi:glycosyltransferase involved in cell wall biosynthesis